MELGEALRNTENLSKELTLLSSGAFSATSFLWTEAINCGKAATAALGPAGPVKPKNPWALGPFILRIFFHNPFPQPFSTTRGAGRAPSRPKGAEPF